MGAHKCQVPTYCIKKGRRIEYSRASQYFQGPEEQANDCYPTLIPNWDHSPRSGRAGHILVRSTPRNLKDMLWYLSTIYHIRL